MGGAMLGNPLLRNPPQPPFFKGGSDYPDRAGRGIPPFFKGENEYPELARSAVPPFSKGGQGGFALAFDTGAHH